MVLTSSADVQNPPAAVPHAYAIIEVVEGGVIGDEYGPALERQPHLTAERLDASDVAEARHEGPAEIELATADFDAEDRDRVFAQPFGRHVNGPRVLGLEAVEVVAPERLLAASPPPAESSLVRRTGGDGDAAVEETRMRLLDSGRGGDRRRNRRVGTEVPLECGVADGDG